MSEEAKTDEYEYAEAEKKLRADSGKVEPFFTALIGHDAGRIFKIGDGETTVGRSKEADISLNDSTVSRHHATVRRLDNGEIEISDAGSTNGIFCNGEKAASHVLGHDDRILIGLNTIFRFSMKDPLEEKYERQQVEAQQRDALTDCYNKHYLQDRLPQEHAYARRHEQDVTLCLFDVDGMKGINETHSQRGGDLVLRHVAQIAQASLRREDELSRYADDCFAVLLRGIVAERAAEIAERLCKNVSNRPVEYDEAAIELTICVGLVTLVANSEVSVGDWIAAAEGQLAIAQEDGTNRIAAAKI